MNCWNLLWQKQPLGLTAYNLKITENLNILSVISNLEPSTTNCYNLSHWTVATRQYCHMTWMEVNIDNNYAIAPWQIHYFCFSVHQIQRLENMWSWRIRIICSCSKQTALLINVNGMWTLSCMYVVAKKTLKSIVSSVVWNDIWNAVAVCRRHVD